MTNTTGAEKSVAVLVSGTPAVGAPYNIVLDFDNAAYPEPMLVRATVRKDVAISGLTITGVLSLPDGTSLDIALQDSGAGADNIADDGTYSASIPYATDGNYNLTVNVSNAAGQAQTTFNSVALGVGRDGRSSDPVPEPVTGNFTRSSSATAVVRGFAADDHGNDVAAGCTAITDTTVATAGRIDTAGDVDGFTFTPTSWPAADLKPSSTRVMAFGGDVAPAGQVSRAERAGHSLIMTAAGSTVSPAVSHKPPPSAP